MLKNLQADLSYNEASPLSSIWVGYPKHFLSYSRETHSPMIITALLTIVTNNIKYLDVTLTKPVKDMYDKNFKSLKKVLEDLRRWKDLPCSWIGRINIVKVAILPS